MPSRGQFRAVFRRPGRKTAQQETVPQNGAMLLNVLPGKNFFSDEIEQILYWAFRVLIIFDFWDFYVALAWNGKFPFRAGAWPGSARRGGGGQV